ncbi:hypothetical protein PR202_gb28448 [Eleusine coracana subsp. coracana]|uniref:Uncharacterized protein n=1 Tax=Eleusine coracana subsp. coracana TaxID=191504 RepID=A0AAV5FX74_ELECO|nr:hypothetical protein PR202_gb28448 [Eleusine coracana subsp. coracana]
MAGPVGRTKKLKKSMGSAKMQAAAPDYACPSSPGKKRKKRQKMKKILMPPEMTRENPVPFPCRVQYLDAQHNMSFVALSSAKLSWIVRAGGSSHGGQEGQTAIVFDCKTGSVIKGPNLTESKDTPVVVTVGERVYALSSTPSMWMPPDLPPWFEVLDLSGASCVDGQLTNCTWCPLPPPPFFPMLGYDGCSRLDRGPPNVEVESYVVVGNYILLSIINNPFTEKDAGTVAFDTIAQEWLDLDQRDLPFVGQAVPYGRLFLGSSRSGDFTAYDISVTETKTELMLSITEVPVITDGITNDDTPLISGQFFATLGDGVICGVGYCTESWTCREEIEKDAIYMSSHSPISGDDEQAGKVVLSSSPSKYFFRLHESKCHLIAPSLVAAPCLRMRDELVKQNEETTELTTKLDNMSSKQRLHVWALASSFL